MEIKNLKKAILKIKKAIKEQKKFVLFSDMDIDGIVSLIILEKGLKKIGGKIVGRYFAERNKERYGLSKKFLRIFKKHSPAFLILTDCGMSNFSEIKLAQKMGLKVIIIDHHLPLNRIPPAEIIINPHQKNDPYPFKFLTAGTLCFKFAQALLKNEMPESLRRDFLGLITLTIFADKMPLENENKIFIEEGLNYLPLSPRAGLRLFFKKFKIENLKKDIYQIIWALQITDKNYLPESYKLLTWPQGKKLKKLFNLVIKKSFKKGKIIKNLASQIEKKISLLPLFIFEGGQEFLNFTGPVANWLFVKFKIPVFIFSSQGNKVKGSIRAPKEINTIEIFKKCQFCLETYGGHASASGCALKKKNLEKFKKCLEKELLEKIIQIT